MHNHSWENEFNLHVNEISFSYERMSISKWPIADEAINDAALEVASGTVIFKNTTNPPQHTTSLACRIVYNKDNQNQLTISGLFYSCQLY